MQNKKRKKILGFTLIELLAVVAIVSSIPAGSYANAKRRALELNCQHNLRQISLALQMFTLSNGTLPQASFYPENPAKDKDSIIVILKSYGGSPALFVDPGAPEELQKSGLTYIWNDTFNGKDPDRIPNASKEWLMIEMCAVSKNVPAAHRNGYNILYVDGHVAWTNKKPDFNRDQ